MEKIKGDVVEHYELIQMNWMKRILFACTDEPSLACTDEPVFACTDDPSTPSSKNKLLKSNTENVLYQEDPPTSLGNLFSNFTRKGSYK